MTVPAGNRAMTAAREGSAMTVLALETATAGVGYAVVGEHGAVIEHVAARPPAASEGLLDTLARGFAEADVTRDMVGGIAVTHGPGSFTGVRVGLAAAQGLAVGLGLPLTTVSTLDAILASLLPRDGLAVAAIDARRGEVYAMAARAAVAEDGNVVALLEPMAATPAIVADHLAPLAAPPDRDPVSVVIAGSGAEELAAALAARVPGGRITIAPEPLWTPRPAVVGWLGRLRLLAGQAVPPENAAALYLRDANALRVQARAAVVRRTGAPA